MTADSVSGIPLKYIALLTLIVQNSTLVLVMRYSRTIDGPAYNPATAVVMSELIKFIVCLLCHIRLEMRTRRMTVWEVWNDVFGTEGRLLTIQSDWLPMTVPSILYFFQNNLQYIAVTLLDAATFQVTYQLKILTTALFSVLLLRRSLSIQKWAALAFLTVGVAVVQLPASATPAKASVGMGGRFLGLLSVGAACVLSGLAGVWFEKVLKGTRASLFLRNIQLSLFSIIPGLVFGVYIANGQEIAQNGFFHGYNRWTWATILCQALGGLIVAVVVKYADNILKGFATSLSIIISCLVSVVLFQFEITAAFCIGAVVVLYEKQIPVLPTLASSRAAYAKLES
ncbi:hypothetical protein HDV03_002856 [Kappamyces sp. JEL0829]|nr:hypothetical protein HDV03_002856 [Kappamyces sp. JEL0829]